YKYGKIYKLKVNVDKGCKFIHKIVTDMANSNDSQHFGGLRPGQHHRDVNADRAMRPMSVMPCKKANGYRQQIQRKVQRNKPLSEAQQERNDPTAKTRAQVEHAFA
ncbi:MAG: transposase, partial [Methylacidiphilales bacterium]|nr:transposase [Candidatus Methylacidiphilales bacterium]